MHSFIKAVSLAVLIGTAFLFSSQGFALSNTSLLFSDKAKVVLKQDNCARGAAEGAANEMVMIIMEHGADIPEEIWIENIEVLEDESSYSITIADYKFLVEVDCECNAVSVIY